MRISVDYERCEGHGICAVSAPDVFSLDDDGLVRYAYQGQDVPDSVTSDAQFAANTCPVAALRPE